MRKDLLGCGLSFSEPASYPIATESESINASLSEKENCSIQPIKKSNNAHMKILGIGDSKDIKAGETNESFGTSHSLNRKEQLQL